MLIFIGGGNRIERPGNIFCITLIARSVMTMSALARNNWPLKSYFIYYISKPRYSSLEILNLHRGGKL